jgi:uncharacterized protein (DUF433 family)
MPQPFSLIGRGVYSLSEAERLTRIPAKRVRRWAQGYSYWYRGRLRHTPPVIANQVDPIDGSPVLTFGDLIEIRFLDAFRQYGVSWKAIKVAAARAQDLLGRRYPFSSKRFKTDGYTILAELVPRSGDRMLLDLVRDQYAFDQIVSPYLYAGIEFDGLDEPTRWWPLGFGRQVVIDPARMFGAPIVAEEGIPTHMLANAMRIEESAEAVRAWYRVSDVALADAVEFEDSFAA